MRTVERHFLALFLACLPSVVHGQNALSLKYGTPKTQPLQYQIVTVEKVSQLDHDGRAKRLKTRNEKLVSQHLRRLHSGHRVEMKVLRSLLEVNGEKLAQDLAGASFQAFRSLRGRYGMDEEQPVPEWNRLGLVFPHRPLCIGEEWKVTDPPAKNFPIPVTTRYVLEGIRPVKGRTCAIISGSTRVNETLPQRGITVRIVTKAKIYFDVADGVLVHSKSRTRYNLLCPENNAMGLKRMVKDIQVQVSLR